MSMQNDAGETILYIAAENGVMDLFCFLLSFCDLEIIKIRSKSDMNAFHVAAKRGNLEIVREILNICPEACKLCDSSSTSSLYFASVQDHLDVVNAILDVDVSSMMIVRKNGKTALHNAARYDILRIVKALIERDSAIVCIKDRKGQTALHCIWAVKGQSTSVVEEILQADSMVLNERDKKGNTALHMATRKVCLQIVSFLLSYASMKVNAINNQQETALDLADKLPYRDSSLEIKEALSECIAKN
ncbi:ankyrin repeat-containing protein [Trifolium pratense]|uniref:Ankyrin repeat-containing protein n=1 Tax=Trifolium pratense TaxID=57577 RepID=A0A2K3PHQ6_TRIPR|nr:ankyrin repeat-containing protein [Trifolium pratense]